MASKTTTLDNLLCSWGYMTTSAAWKFFNQKQTQSRFMEARNHPKMQESRVAGRAHRVAKRLTNLEYQLRRHHA